MNSSKLEKEIFNDREELTGIFIKLKGGCNICHNNILLKAAKLNSTDYTVASLVKFHIAFTDNDIIIKKNYDGVYNFNDYSHIEFNYFYKSEFTNFLLNKLRKKKISDKISNRIDKYLTPFDKMHSFFGFYSFIDSNHFNNMFYLQDSYDLKNRNNYDLLKYKEIYNTLKYKPLFVCKKCLTIINSTIKKISI